MVLMKKSILFPFIFLLLSISFVSAQDFSVETTEPETIYAGQKTEFIITIQNQGEEDWFSISILGTKPAWVSLENTNVRLSSGESANVKVWVTPSLDAFQASYSFLVIISNSKEKIEKEVFVSVKQKALAVISDIELSCISCKPNENITVSSEVKNVGSRVLRNLKLIVSLDSEKITKNIEILDLSEIKQFSSIFQIPAMKEPGRYIINLELMQDNEVLDKKNTSFSIPRITDVETDKIISQTIFSKSVMLTATNKGNVQTTAQIKSDVSKDWYVVYSGEQPDKKNGEHIWVVTLNKGEETQIKYSEIYWPVILLLLLIITSIIYYYNTLQKLSIKKKILQKHTAKEGREFSVSIEIKNRGKSVEDVVVRDVIPSMFELIEKFETRKPTIKKIETGNRLTWRIGRLKPHEERVLHYKIKTLVGIIGNTKLPKATVKGRCEEKTFLHKSNIAVLQGLKEK